MGWRVVGLILACCSLTAAQDEHRPKYIQAGSPAGVGKYDPGKWGIASVQLANPSDEPVEVLSTLSFQHHGDLQFGRRVWLPARARRSTWFPVRAPEQAPASGRVWEVQSLLFDADDEGETPIPATFGQMRVENLLPMGRGQSITGLIADPENEYDLTQLLWASRLSRNLGMRFVTLYAHQLPPTVESLDGLDQLVVASDVVLSDARACSAIRDWLHRGGHLWVMLDKVDPQLLSRLAGDTLQLAIVDRLDRRRLQLYSHDSRGTQPSGDEREFVDPVAMVRAVFSGGRVSHTLDDWPAAVWSDIGRGKLLVTTVGVRALLRPRTALDQLPHLPDDPTEGVHFVAATPLQEVAFEFLGEPQAPPLEPGDLQHVVSEQIGYRIAGRGQVAAILGTFCIALGGLGAYLYKQGRLEHLGWAGLLGVVVTSFSLLGMGRSSRESVPKTVAVTQFVEASPHSDEVQVSGLVATYSSDKSSGLLRAAEGGLFWPELAGREGTVVRMISTDRDEWELRNLVLPAGQQLIPFARSSRLDQPVRAIGTFGPEGFRGTLQAGPLERTGDAVLAMPSTRNLAVQLESDGQFTSGADNVLAPGQFLTGSVLSDEQRRRREIYQLMFDKADGDHPYPDRRALLVWADPLDLGFQLLDGAEHTGSALVSVPLEVTSPEPGTRVVIPGPFIPYRAVGAETSATFDKRRRRWSEPFSQGRDTTLMFRLPEEVLPLQPDRATLRVDLKAPSRELAITGSVGGEHVVLETRRSPLGHLQFDITRVDALQVNDAGEMTFGINIGDARDDESNLPLDPSEVQMWQINDVQLEVSGVTLAP